ncbi:hypothetical protein ACWD0Z_36635 [Streptomyces sp. NPDC003007]
MGGPFVRVDVWSAWTSYLTSPVRLGTEAEVLGPPALRQAVARAVAVLADRYGQP